MNARQYIGGFSTLICVGLISGVFVQHWQLTKLRGQQEQLRIGISASDTPPMQTVESDSRDVIDLDSRRPSPELLHLRNEVGQLLEEKRELAGVREENQRLRKQVAFNKTNAPTGPLIPPHYIRASKAEWVGLSRPQDTMQSFLWAVRSRNITNMLRVLTPEAGEKFLKLYAVSPSRFFDDSSKLPGFGITKVEPVPGSGGTYMRVQFFLGINPGGNIEMKKINGEWRLAEF